VPCDSSLCRTARDTILTNHHRASTSSTDASNKTNKRQTEDVVEVDVEVIRCHTGHEAVSL